MSIIHLAYEYENTTVLILITINIEKKMALLVLLTDLIHVNKKI